MTGGGDRVAVDSLAQRLDRESEVFRQIASAPKSAPRSPETLARNIPHESTDFRRTAVRQSM